MYRRVLLPTDGSDATDRAVDHALELASTYDAELHVLSVLDDASLASVSGEAMEELRAEADAAVETIADRAESTGIDAVTTIREGSPHAEILDYAEAAGVDMIVMSTHGRSGVGRVLLGSVTERVVRESHVPVVTVRRDAESGSVQTADGARKRAQEALADAGHQAIEFPEDPHRTTSAWVVPARTASGSFNVHVDAGDGSTRIAEIGGSE